MQLANMLEAVVLHDITADLDGYAFDEDDTPAFEDLLRWLSLEDTDFVIAYSRDHLFYKDGVYVRDRDRVLASALARPVKRTPGRLPTRIMLVTEDAPFLVF